MSIFGIPLCLFFDEKNKQKRLVAMESQKTTIELKLSFAELDLILDALDAYPDSENVQGMDGKNLTALEKLGRYLTCGNLFPQIESLWSNKEINSEYWSRWTSRLFDIRGKYCLLGEDLMPENI